MNAAIPPFRRLLASVHDVTPAHEQRLDRLVPAVEAIVGAGRFALLVVPDFHGDAPLVAGTPFAHRIRRWAEAGCDIFLHGYTHRDDIAHRGRLARWKAARMTAGEGEFLGLSYHDAVRRLSAGRALIEDVTGRPVAGFIAPAWLYGADSRRAVADMGFRLAEDHFSLWRPADGQVLVRGPVITYASRTPSRLASSLVWSRLATALLRRAPIVRHAVHPHDVDAPALVAEIERALRCFTRSHHPSAYHEVEDCGSGDARRLLDDGIAREGRVRQLDRTGSRRGEP